MADNLVMAVSAASNQTSFCEILRFSYGRPEISDMCPSSSRMGLDDPHVAIGTSARKVGLNAAQISQCTPEPEM
jgi:hypothetical protein